MNPVPSEDTGPEPEPDEADWLFASPDDVHDHQPPTLSKERRRQLADYQRRALDSPCEACQ